MRLINLAVFFFGLVVIFLLPLLHVVSSLTGKTYITFHQYLAAVLLFLGLVQLLQLGRGEARNSRHS
jgi:uncharacterized membrane protein